MHSSSDGGHCRSVLLKVQAGLFEEWVFQFGREMIVFSSHHPTVSGFYKLLAICFKLCKHIDYFKVNRLGSVGTSIST